MSDLASQFDYASLDTEARVVVKQKTTEIRDRMKRAASDIVAIGERLIAVKEVLAHGKFGAWLRAEFDWDERSARRMMGVAEAFKSDNLADLPIAPSALYLLASDSTPAEVRDEVIAEAKSGKPISHADVKQRVEATRLRTCGRCGSKWMSGEADCPYCNKSPQERIDGLQDSKRSLDEQCADENAYLDSLGMGGGEPAAPKRVNIKHADDADDDVPATVNLARPAVATRTASRQREAATWEWSKAFQTILECLNVIDQSGGIGAVAREWDAAERADYSNGINEVIDRFTAFRAELRRKS